MLFDDITYSGSEFQRVETAIWVLTLGIDHKWKQDERSSLVLCAKESLENRYEGSPEEKVW